MNNAEKLREYDRKYAKKNRARKSAARVEWRQQNLERDKETARRYAERNRDSIRERDRARYPRERDQRVEYNRQYYMADKSKRIAQVRQWRLDNPELAAAKGVRDRARRRARLRGLPIERWTEEQVIERDGLVCWLGGCSVGERSDDDRRDWAIDHLIPIGVDYPDHPGDTLANLAIACHPCNIWKFNRILPAAIARYEANLSYGERVHR